MSIEVCRPQGIVPVACNRSSGALLPEHFRRLSYKSRQPDQVVRGATEDEQPIHFLQTPQLDLAQRAGLLQPSKALFDQPSTAEADRIAGLAWGSAVQVAGAALVVPGNVRCHVQLPHRADEILRVVSLVRTHRDAA